MRAYIVRGAGGPAAVETVARPIPGPGQVLVRIRACALNFADTLMIKGSYQETPPPPFSPGLEVAGEIADPNGSGFAPGQRVAVFAGNGGLAEYGAFDATRVIPLPDAMPDDVAAAVQVAYGTSHLALAHRARLQPGETLLVLGAAGGVGLTAVELGKLMGARVIAVAKGAEKLALAQRAGADHLIDAEAPDLRDQVRALGGADVVYDPVGGPLFTQAFRACNPEARVLVIGFASGDLPEVRPNHLMVKNIDILGVYWGGYMTFAPKVLTDSLAQIMAWYAEGRIAPHVSDRFPLDRVEEGLDMLRNRTATGKIVIEI